MTQDKLTSRTSSINDHKVQQRTVESNLPLTDITSLGGTQNIPVLNSIIKCLGSSNITKENICLPWAARLSIVLSQQNHRYKPLLRLLFYQELSKAHQKEQLSEAVIIDIIKKIDKIIEDATQHPSIGPSGLLSRALSQIVQNECKHTPSDDIAQNCQIISNHLNNPENSLDLITLLHQNLSVPSPPQGFFASLRHAILHKFELAKEKIWGKATVTNSTNKIPEKDFENPHKDGQDHSKSYFETIFTPIKDTCVWIFTLGGLFSTPSETNQQINQKNISETANDHLNKANGHSSPHNAKDPQNYDRVDKSDSSLISTDTDQKLTNDNIKSRPDNIPTDHEDPFPLEIIEIFKVDNQSPNINYADYFQHNISDLYSEILSDTEEESDND